MTWREWMQYRFLEAAIGLAVVLIAVIIVYIIDKKKGQMKSKIFIALTAVIAISCSKSQEDTLKPVEKSFTQWHHIRNESDSVVKIELVVHWHRVSGADLAVYEQFPGKQRYCDRNDILESVIGPPCGEECILGKGK